MKRYNLLLELTNGKTRTLVASNDIDYFNKRYWYFRNLFVFTNTTLIVKVVDIND